MGVARSRVRVIAVAVVVGVVVTAAGCDARSPGTASQSPSAEERSFDPFIESAIQAARGHGASLEQVAILESARDVGEVTPQMLHEASALAGECFEAAGVVAWFEASRPGDPTAGLDYIVQLDSDASQQLADECVARHYDDVQYAFGVQPHAQEWGDQRLLEARPALVACIRDNGGAIADEPTADELRVALFRLANGVDFGQQPLPADQYEPVDCASQAGVPGY